jgi:hypothetical protein
MLPAGTVAYGEGTPHEACHQSKRGHSNACDGTGASGQQASTQQYYTTTTPQGDNSRASPNTLPASTSRALALAVHIHINTVIADHTHTRAPAIPKALPRDMRVRQTA